MKLLDRQLNREENVVQVAATVSTAYLCYFTADAAWKTSGVIATVSMGVFIGTFGHATINDAKLLEDLKASGVILNYALFDAVAQMRYTEPVPTLDADVLVLLGDDTGLDVLGPIYNFCRKRGYVPQGEAIRVGNWPVQFVPTFSKLTEEAVREAEFGEIGGIPIRVVSANHLAVIALSVGRTKDHLRILALIEAGEVHEDVGEVAVAPPPPAPPPVVREPVVSPTTCCCTLSAPCCTVCGTPRRRPPASARSRSASANCGP